MSSPKFEVIYQHPNFIVINKYPDVNFHDEGDINQGLFNQVKHSLNLPELYPVHRLDKMTSGLLILAKNAKTANSFQTLFSEKNVEKFYLAVALQKPKKKQGLIKGDMEKSRRSSWKLTRTMNNPAITQFFSYGIGEGTRLFLVKPHTGKTHQIRVALASVGSPILGDPIYNKQSADRGYLHAYQISFTLNNEYFTFKRLPQPNGYFSSHNWPDNVKTAINTPEQLAWPTVK